MGVRSLAGNCVERMLCTTAGAAALRLEIVFPAPPSAREIVITSKNTIERIVVFIRIFMFFQWPYAELRQSFVPRSCLVPSLAATFGSCHKIVPLGIFCALKTPTGQFNYPFSAFSGQITGFPGDTGASVK